MQEISINAIFIGIIVGLIGVYFKEIMREAFVRKKVAIRLHAHIINWYTSLYENEDLHKVAIIGEEWYKDEIEAVRSKKKGALEKVQEKYEEIMKETEKSLNRKNSRLYKEIVGDFKKLTNEEILAHIELFNEQRKALLENKLFITDEEAANLGWVVASRVLNINSKFMTFFINFHHLLNIISKLGTDNQQKVVKYLIPLVNALISIAKDMKPLHNYTDRIKDKKVIYFIRP